MNKDITALRKHGQEIASVILDISEEQHNRDPIITSAKMKLLRDAARQIADCFQAYDTMILNLVSADVELRVKKDAIQPTINAYKLGKITFEELKEELNKI